MALICQQQDVDNCDLSQRSKMGHKERENLRCKTSSVMHFPSISLCCLSQSNLETSHSRKLQSRFPRFLVPDVHTVRNKKPFQAWSFSVDWMFLTTAKIFNKSWSSKDNRRQMKRRHVRNLEHFQKRKIQAIEFRTWIGTWSVSYIKKENTKELSSALGECSQKEFIATAFGSWSVFTKGKPKQLSLEWEERHTMSSWELSVAGAYSSMILIPLLAHQQQPKKKKKTRADLAANDDEEDDQE